MREAAGIDDVVPHVVLEDPAPSRRLFLVLGSILAYAPGNAHGITVGRTKLSSAQAVLAAAAAPGGLGKF